MLGKLGSILFVGGIVFTGIALYQMYEASQEASDDVYDIETEKTKEDRSSQDIRSRRCEYGRKSHLHEDPEQNYQEKDGRSVEEVPQDCSKSPFCKNVRAQHAPQS